MIHSDENVRQGSPSLESLRAAARDAMKRTRGFSLAQEALFAGNGRTLRAALLAKWQRLLGLPFAQEESAQRGPATVVVDIQNHEIGSGGEHLGKGGTLDRVREMGIVRGAVYQSKRRMATRPREILLEIQKAVFVRQFLPVEEEGAWSRASLPKRVWSMLWALTRHPPEVSLRDPGRVWKDFVARFPPETLYYQCQVRENLDLGHPQVLTDLLLATARAMQEFAQPTREAGQPLGYVRTFATQATEIRPYQPGQVLPVCLYQEAGHKAKGTLVSIQPGEERSTFYAKISKAVHNRDNWQDLKAFDQALIAVNVTTPRQPGEGMFSQASVRSGFKAGRRAHPWLVFYNGRDTRGNLHLQASVDHFACDGRLLALFIMGGEAGGRSFDGLAGFYECETGEACLERTPKALGGLEICDYGQVVLAEMPRPQVQAGGDLFTCAVLWAIGLYVNYMQETRGGIWKKLSPNTACNFTVTEKGNPLKPLRVASCWLGNPEGYAPDSAFYPYRHVLGLTAGLIGFKLGKELTSGKKNRLPEAMYWMSLLVHNRFPDWFTKTILVLNRSPALTDVRNHLFPPTVIFEKADGTLVHTTAAGTDLPNVVICDIHKEDQVALAFSVAPHSQFVSPGELGPLVEWIASTMQEFLGTVGQWQQKDAGTLRGLNHRIEALYQKKRDELAAIRVQRTPSWCACKTRWPPLLAP
jgi:hypothetical protein